MGVGRDCLWWDAGPVKCRVILNLYKVMSVLWVVGKKRRRR